MELTHLFGAMPGAFSQGVLWGILVLGVFITFRILNIADMTCDGSFALGGCVSAFLVVNGGIDPVVAVFLAFFIGAAAGFITGILHTMFGIPAILAGILTQYSLWSINLRILQGKSNVPFGRDNPTIFTGLTELTGLTNSEISLIVGSVIAIIFIAILYWFFGTQFGSSLRATGNNEDMIRALGVNIKFTKVVALMLSNGLIAVSGSLVAQSQKYADIGMGTGAIVIALASIVIGEVLLGKLKSFASKLAAVVIGCMVYMAIRAFVLWVGLDTNDMKLISAVIVAAALATPVVLAKIRQKRAYSPYGGDV